MTAGGAAPVRVLGIAGSLRARSYNRALLRAACDLAPEGMAIEIFDRVGELPLFNPDIPVDSVPTAVALKAEIAAAQAVLFAVPEYNAGIPSPLKNAIEWASRPRAATPLRGKPVGMFGASQGPGGTSRAHAAMRETLYYLAARIQPPPELLIARVQDLVDDAGVLRDDDTRAALRDYLLALRDWALLWRGAGA